MTETQEKMFAFLKSDEFVEWAVENLHRADATYREGVVQAMVVWSLNEAGEFTDEFTSLLFSQVVETLNMEGQEKVLTDDVKKLVNRLAEFLPPEKNDHVEA